MTNPIILPQNLEAEQATLGSLLLDRAMIPEVQAILTAECFSQEAHKKIFQAIGKLYFQNEPIDSITLTDYLKDKGDLEAIGGVMYLVSLTDKTPTAAHAVSHARIVKEKNTLRQILKINHAMIEKTSAGEIKSDRILEEGNQEISELSGQSLKAILTPPQSLVSVFEKFMSEVKNPSIGYQSGFIKLDNLLHGLRPGVFVIAAPPSAGKTTFVNQLAGQVCANGEPVLFFSYEQSAGELFFKSIARHFKISNEAFFTDEKTRQNAVLDKIQGQALKEWQEGAGRLKVIEADERHTVNKIRRLAEDEKKQSGRPPLIVLDYLQIIPDTEKYNSTRDKTNAAITGLRRISRDLDTPVIVVSSMPRGEYERITMSGFKESGGIEYGADIAALLEVEKENGQKRDMVLNIIKHRSGKRAKIFFSYDLIRDTFTETARGIENIDYRQSLGMNDTSDHPAERGTRMAKTKEGEKPAWAK